MDDGIDVFGVEDLGEALAGARRGDVHAVQAGAFDAGGLAVAQIVDDDDPFAGLVKRVDDMGADIAAPTSDENCHVWPFDCSVGSCEQRLPFEPLFTFALICYFLYNLSIARCTRFGLLCFSIRHGGSCELRGDDPDRRT